MENIPLDKESVLFAHKLSEKLNSEGVSIWRKGNGDMDFMMWEEDFKKFQEMLTNRSFSRFPSFTWNLQGFPDASRVCNITLNKRFCMDIFSLEKLPDGVRCTTHLGEFAKYHYQNLKKIKFENLDFYIPNPDVPEQKNAVEETPWGSKTIEEITGCVMGVFDLFHIGHLRLLKRSGKIFDKVVAAVHSDEVVMEYKKKKPVIPYEDRLEIVSSCKYVDEVIEAPLRPQTVEFLNNNNLDYLVHGKTEPKFLEEHYSEIIKEHRLFLLEETKDYHTTHLKKRKDGAYYTIPFTD